MTAPRGPDPGVTFISCAFKDLTYYLQVFVGWCLLSSTGLLYLSLTYSYKAGHLTNAHGSKMVYDVRRSQ